MDIQIVCPAFASGESIPKKFTCEGQDVSPPLVWSNLPDGTVGLALIVDDPDAPAGDWVHWLLYNLPDNLTALPEGAKGVGVEGVNSWGSRGYRGPCPPRGKTHRYVFKLYALSQTLVLKPGASKAEVEKAMRGHILAEGQLIARFAR